MNTFIGLLRRELQEHPALYIGPLGVNLFVAVSAMLLVARAIGSAENLRNIVGLIDVAGDQAVNIGRSALIASPMWLVVVVTIAVGYFYFIDCLYAERKERTILFFKSFPITDTQTVLSKLFCGVVILPALSLAAFALTQLFVLVVVSIALAAAQGSPGTLWSAGAILTNWAFAFYVLLSCALWYAPFIAFLMLASAWAKRAVLLWSFAPFLVVQAEFLLPGRNIIAPVITNHLTGYPAAAFVFGDLIRGSSEQSAAELFQGGTLRPLELADPGGFVTEPALWAGLIVAALFVTAAIYLRRYRDDG
jgi:ABC-2 type transport system permease protein